MELLTSLTQPLVLFGELISAFLIMNLFGFDVRSMFRKYLGTEDNVEHDALARNNAQSILGNVQAQMQELAEHFNHETTAQWDEVKITLREHTKRHEVNERMLAEVITLFKEIKEYGIKCRRD